jgi:hypothetical protein
VEPVSINGDVIHALRAHAGVTIGCGLSNMAVDNKKHFPHPVYLASFTKATALIVDRLKKDGSPQHAIRYHHGYGHITDLNDAGMLKRMAKHTPALMEKPFTLRPPRPAAPSGKSSGKTPPERRGKTDRFRAFVPRGALARAVKAGRIGEHVAQQLNDVANTSD